MNIKTSVKPYLLTSSGVRTRLMIRIGLQLYCTHIAPGHFFSQSCWNIKFFTDADWRIPLSRSWSLYSEVINLLVTPELYFYFLAEDPPIIFASQWFPIPVWDTGMCMWHPRLAKMPVHWSFCFIYTVCLLLLEKS